MHQDAGKLTNKAKPLQKNCACWSPGYPTRILFDGQDRIPAFRRIVAADFSEFGTSANNLDKLSMAVEIDDAPLALDCS